MQTKQEWNRDKENQPKNYDNDMKGTDAVGGYGFKLKS